MDSTSFFDSLNQLVGTIFDFSTSIFNLYTGNILLAGVLALWLLRKIARLYRHL